MIVDAAAMRWEVDPSGYEWFEPPEGEEGGATLGHKGPFLVQKGLSQAPRLVRTYSIEPMEFPALFHELAMTPPTHEGIVKFADRFGFLGVGGYARVGWKVDWEQEPADEITAMLRERGHVHIPGEPFSLWEHEIERIDLAFRCWVALRDDDRERFAELENYLTLADSSESDIVGWGLPQQTKTPNPVAETMEFLVSRGLANRVSGILQRKDDGTGWETIFTPLALIGAIWIQFSQAIASGGWKDCEHCGAPFKPNSSLALYCSDSHKQLAYQKRRARKESR